MLPAEVVSQELLGARIGVCFHPPTLLAKSTVHAAYCAHGVAPVILAPGPNAPEVALGEQYWQPGLALEALPEIAVRACKWYRGHALAVQADRYRRLLSA